MIPGALVALCLCLLLDRDGDDAAIIAAWGAIGIGFGGQETYGQTIGLALNPETRAWGLTGLTLKGAMWGFLGGAVIALALTRDRHSRRSIFIALALMCAATFAGWKLFNEPKLVYFSHPTDRPRAEIWFGLVAGAFALLIYLRSKVLWRFALIGAVTGGVGFGAGSYIQVLGIPYPNPIIGYWKQMELFFGFLLGVGLGYSAWLHRDQLARQDRPVTLNWIAPLIVPVALLANRLPGRVRYSFLGGILLAIALAWPPAARHIAITMTYCAFSIDFLVARPTWDQTLLWGLVIASTILVAWCVEYFADRPNSAWSWFLLLLCTSVLNSMAKSFAPGGRGGHGLLAMEALFAAMALAAILLRPRSPAAIAPSSELGTQRG
jgi:hypothetical protein